MECFLCKQIKQPTERVKIPSFPCDSCRNTCAECSELSTTEIRCIPLQKRPLKYQCKKCRNLDTLEILQNTIIDKEKIIEDQEIIIKLLQEKINTLEKSNVPSYSSILKQQQIIGSKPIKTSCPKIIVKPKQQQLSEQTKKDINTNINPAKLKIGIANIKPSRSGMMIITCQTKNETEILKEALEDKLKNDYNIELSKLKSPKIKIVNFNQDYNNEEIENYIKEQNDIPGEITVNYIRSNRNGTKTILMHSTI
ncbi:hypothetical protein JTB14_031156 [Gonioctena quinquepunctata]|nr:hypothetical protein JTB14_031156 [Gonioctena quinquepunctata]